MAQAQFDGTARLVRLHFLGVFAQFAEAESEPVGTMGASVLLDDDEELTYRQDLFNGRHYSDARDLNPVGLILGDGTSVETVGITELDGEAYRVDLITMDVPAGVEANQLRFRSHATPSSFALFDIFIETEAVPGCPFSSRTDGISLSEIGPIIRMGDRVRFTSAIDQLTKSLHTVSDLDEARGQALTFLALVTAAMLESGGSRELHREQLEAAREFDRIQSVEGLATAARNRAERVAEPLFREAASPSSYLVDRALALVERNFAKNLTDSVVAQQLGLSTSHFRYLFRQVTGHPFHKYLVGLRLEKARQMLIEQEVPVGTVARAVGFAGLSHFSRAFTQRFQVSPTNVRRTGE